MPIDDEFGPRGAPGRRLPPRGSAPPKRPPRDAPAAGPDPAPTAPVDPRAPFTPHQADPATLLGAPDRGPANRAPVLVVVTTLVTGLFVVLLLGLSMAEGWQPPEPAAVVVTDDPRHIADPAYSGRIVDDGPAAVPTPQGPAPGPIKIFTSAEYDFVSIEVDCSVSGYQRRGRFFPEGKGKMAATVREVPPDERCRVTFQGTEAATTWAFAHETRECTFNPTVCPVR